MTATAFDSVKLLRVEQGEGDALHIVFLANGTDEREATGWVSALMNHYDTSAYDANGNLNPKAKPRQMTRAEIVDYCMAAITEQFPAPVARTVLGEF